MKQMIDKTGGTTASSFHRLLKQMVSKHPKPYNKIYFLNNNLNHTCNEQFFKFETSRDFLSLYPVIVVEQPL